MIRQPRLNFNPKTLPVNPSNPGSKNSNKNSTPDFTKLFLSTYNIRTLLGDDALIQLEEELKTIKWDVIGISEVRRKGENLIVLDSGHTLFSIGNDKSIGGVGFLVNKSISSNTIEYKGISDRIAYLVLEINEKICLKIIQVYAPTSTHSDETIESFYEELADAIEQTPTKYTIIMGDFNAKLGAKEELTEERVGNFGYGVRNDRGRTLYNFMEQQNLFAMNSFFKKQPHRKWTWISPDKTTKNEIDFIISTDKSIITDITVLNRFTTGSDHRMVRATVTIKHKMNRIKWTRRKQLKINPDTIKNNAIEYQIELKNSLKSINYNTNPNLNNLNSAITSAIKKATQKIDTHQQTKERKVTQEIKDMLKERRKMAQEGKRQTPEFNTINRAIREKIKNHTKENLDKKIEKVIEENSKMKVLRPKIGTAQIYSLEDEDGIEKRNRHQLSQIIQNFYTTLYESKKTPTSPIKINIERKIQNVNSEEIPEISTDEIRQALHQTKNKKAPGKDDILSEMLKEGGEELYRALAFLFNNCLEKGDIPTEWKNAVTVLLYKKGDKKQLSNYRPITLLSQIYKLLTRIITARINNKLELDQPTEQAGFRKGYSTCDHLLTVRTLLEKATEYHLPIYMAFVDYEKAFDTIEIWAIMNALQNIRVDSRYTTLLQKIYKDASISIKFQEETNQIPVKRGVRQGDTISPKLFIAALETIFKSLNWQKKGINVNGEKLNHLRYADDIILFAESAKDLTEMLTELAAESEKVGLKMNTAKTKSMSNSPDILNIKIGNQQIEQVSEYIYLGQLIKPGKENQEAEIYRRIRLGWAAFGKLSFVVKNRTIKQHLKTKVFDQCVLPVLTYGCQTWTLTNQIVQKLAVTQRSMERQMLHITLADRKTKEWIRGKTKVTDIIRRITQLKWSFAGHNARQTDSRWNFKLQHWRPWLGKRGRGRPQMRWGDDIKIHAGFAWTRVAQNRRKWKEIGEAYIQKWIEKGL